MCIRDRCISMRGTRAAIRRGAIGEAIGWEIGWKVGWDAAEVRPRQDTKRAVCGVCGMRDLLRFADVNNREKKTIEFARHRDCCSRLLLEIEQETSANFRPRKAEIRCREPT